MPDDPTVPQEPLLPQHAALDYAARGWRVFPCRPGGKEPLAALARHGCHSATTEPKQIRAWWDAEPDANIAIATGPETGLYVVDVDGSEGAESLAALVAQHGPLPPCPAVRTARGRHLYFRAAPGGRNSAGKLARGLDTRAAGGYVLAPPSIHPSGARYTWQVAPDGLALPEPPEWLLPAAPPAPLPVAAAALPSPANPGRVARHAQADALAAGTVGNGDDTGFDLACQLRDNVLPEAEALATLREYAERVAQDPARPFTGADAERWWRSACARPAREPWPARPPAEPEKEATPAPDGEPEPEPEARQERRPVAEVLVAIGQEATLLHDEREDAYAVLPDAAGTRLERLRGRGFRRWLAGAYHDRTERAANGEALAAALGVLEARAVYRSERVTLHNRFARTQAGIWVDLADGRAVQVTAGGWQVIERPPVLFRRYAHQEPLPEPTLGGKLSDLLPLLAPLPDADALLLTSWLATAPVADIPRPILLLHGSKGTAKTTRARMLRRLLDASAVEDLDAGRDPAALAQVLDHHAVPVFDNVTHLAQWQSDMLCRAVTGGGFSKRELYTDADDVLMTFRRALVLTGINIPTAAPDLLDRCLLIETMPIPPAARREEAVIWREYDRLRPALLGGLLSTLAEAMRVYDRLTLPRLERMADWCHWSAAAAVAQGHRAEDLLTAVTGNVGRQVEEVIEADPVAASVRGLAADGEWRGTASDLLTTLGERVGERAARATDWPRRADGLARRLRTLASTLAEAGVSVTFARRSGSDRTRLVIIRAVSQCHEASEASEASEPAPRLASCPDASAAQASEASGEASGGNPHEPDTSDTSDTSDAGMRTLTPRMVVEI